MPVATLPGVILPRLDVVAAASGLDRRRLLQWILAWTGLSASWFLGFDDPLAEIAMEIAAVAACELDQH